MQSTHIADGFKDIADGFKEVVPFSDTVELRVCGQPCIARYFKDEHNLHGLFGVDNRWQFDSLGEDGGRCRCQTIGETPREANRATAAAQLIKGLTIRADLVSKVGDLLGRMSKTLMPHKPMEALGRNLDRLDIKRMITLVQYYIQHSFKENLLNVKVPILLVVGKKDNLALPGHGWEVSWFMPNCQA